MTSMSLKSSQRLPKYPIRQNVAAHSTKLPISINFQLSIKVRTKKKTTTQLVYFLIQKLHFEQNPGCWQQSSLQILDEMMHIYMAKIKNEVAPIVCEVQSISPPSEIVLVERHKKRQQNIERTPKCRTLLSAWPVISKLFIVRIFYFNIWKLMQNKTGATIMPILKITYWGYFIAVCVMSVCGKGFMSWLCRATWYVHRIVTVATTAPIRGNMRALKPKSPCLLLSSISCSFCLI